MQETGRSEDGDSWYEAFLVFEIASVYSNDGRVFCELWRVSLDRGDDQNHTYCNSQELWNVKK